MDVVADRITKGALMQVVKTPANEPIIEIHASRSDEPLDVSIASVLVWSGVGRLESLKSTAGLANVRLGAILEMLAERPDYVQNVVKAASFRQSVVNELAKGPDRRAGEIEFKWNREFTEVHAKEVVQLVPVLQSASDATAIAKGRAAVYKALTAAPELLKPFADEKPVPPDVLKSRQRTKALIDAGMRPVGGRP